MAGYLARLARQRPEKDYAWGSKIRDVRHMHIKFARINILSMTFGTQRLVAIL